MHSYLLHNNEIKAGSERCLSPGQVGLLNGWGVFSTIRVIRGVLFAFERHWERMKGDASLMRIPFPADQSEMEEGLYRLVEANQAADSTLRVVVVRNRGGMWEGPDISRDYDLIAFTKAPRNWGESVKVGLVRDARHAGSIFSGTKILSWSHNLVWLEEAQERGFDEVILLNENGEVSECTSANIFVSRGGEVWTPPLSSGCLPGVTRQLLLTEIHVEGIAIEERNLTLSDVQRADEVFITSTTRGLLPVSSIEGLGIRCDGSAREPIQEAFSRYVDSYVNAHPRRTA